MLRVNYLGSVWCLRAFLPALEAAGRSDVVNIVSVAGAVAFPPSGPYSASKHAQLAFSRATAGELRSRGIHVHTVNPGFVETEGFPQASTLRSALLRRLVVRPEDVARHVLKTIERDRRETFVPRLVSRRCDRAGRGSGARRAGRGALRLLPPRPVKRGGPVGPCTWCRHPHAPHYRAADGTGFLSKYHAVSAT